MFEHTASLALQLQHSCQNWFFAWTAICCKVPDSSSRGYIWNHPDERVFVACYSQLLVVRAMTDAEFLDEIRRRVGFACVSRHSCCEVAGGGHLQSAVTIPYIIDGKLLGGHEYISSNSLLSEALHVEW